MANYGPNGEGGEYQLMYKLHQIVNCFEILGFKLPNDTYTEHPTPSSGFDKSLVPQYRVKCQICGNILNMGQLNMTIVKSCGCMDKSSTRTKNFKDWEAKSKNI